MAKKNKKKGLKWLWTGDDFAQAAEEDYIQQKLDNTWTDENGVKHTSLLEEEDYADAYGWDRKWQKEDKTKGYDWTDYEKTGKWTGYSNYRSSTLSYSYIMQMANSIADQNNVNVVIGKDWSIDLEKKTLTYNPTSMMFSSKGGLLATLLHEVGKIKLCTQYKDLTSPFLKKYTYSAYEVGVVFDDFRVDATMINAYPSASEVYDSQGEIMDKIVEDYSKIGDAFRGVTRSIMDERIDYINKLIQKGETYEKAYEITFGEKPRGEAKTLAKLQDYYNKEFYVSKPNAFDYIATVVHRGYGLTTHEKKMRTDMLDKFKLTGGAISKIVKKSSSQEVFEIMDTEVYPHIEDLLKQTKEGSDNLKEALGEMVAQIVMGMINEKINNITKEGMNLDTSRKTNGKDKQQVSGGLSEDELPKEWGKGDYESLLDSVKSEIKVLYSKLVNLRRNEQVRKFMDNQKRGRLNMKTLYKFASGSRRLFKKKLDTTDTIRSFTFSIIVDCSGSMAGHRTIHTTRAVIMLSEVFEKLGMEYEIIHFDDMVYQTKKYQDRYDKKIKTKVASYAAGSRGGTLLQRAVDATNILKRPEINKILVVLTDGEVSHERVEEKFQGLMKKGVKIIPIGLECGDSIKRLAGGTGQVVDHSSKMPQVFYDMISKLIFKR